jgi:hypothetical protein
MGASFYQGLTATYEDPHDGAVDAGRLDVRERLEQLLDNVLPQLREVLYCFPHRRDHVACVAQGRKSGQQPA